MFHAAGFSNDDISEIRESVCDAITDASTVPNPSMIWSLPCQRFSWISCAVVNNVVDSSGVPGWRWLVWSLLWAASRVASALVHEMDILEVKCEFHDDEKLVVLPISYVDDTVISCVGKPCEIP